MSTWIVRQRNNGYDLCSNSVSGLPIFNPALTNCCVREILELVSVSDIRGKFQIVDTERSRRAWVYRTSWSIITNAQKLWEHFQRKKGFDLWSFLSITRENFSGLTFVTSFSLYNIPALITPISFHNTQQNMPYLLGICKNWFFCLKNTVASNFYCQHNY